MAIGAVMIDRICNNNENNNIAHYEISSTNFKINNFYMYIDKYNKIIKFFATKNFEENPIRIINYNQNEKLGCLPGIPRTVFTIVLRQAFKTFKMDTFSEHLYYMA